ncbi:hypothetical protein OUZ56_017095 [Daphnia magna]|uniref:Uncharacterized protein n=1 Tax=Daphnia magna TaxID=35525 RepID=A0ABR0ASB5_9CRUS|nr:hypothetical protein OUZ56_017095 [Daphnia magna]
MNWRVREQEKLNPGEKDITEEEEKQISLNAIPINAITHPNQQSAWDFLAREHLHLVEQRLERERLSNIGALLKKHASPVPDFQVTELDDN